MPQRRAPGFDGTPRTQTRFRPGAGSAPAACSQTQVERYREQTCGLLSPRTSAPPTQASVVGQAPCEFPGVAGYPVPARPAVTLSRHQARSICGATSAWRMAWCTRTRSSLTISSGRLAGHRLTLRCASPPLRFGAGRTRAALDGSRMFSMGGSGGVAGARAPERRTSGAQRSFRAQCRCRLVGQDPGHGAPELPVREGGGPPFVLGSVSQVALAHTPIPDVDLGQPPANRRRRDGRQTGRRVAEADRRRCKGLARVLSGNGSGPGGGFPRLSWG